MRLSLRQLQIFVAIADGGTTAVAGERIALSQSAVSAALNELESLLGAPVFDRVGRRLVLNGSGRALLPPARALLAEAADIERRFRIGHAAQSGEGLPEYLKIGASTTIGNYLMPARIAALQGAGVSLRVDLRIGNSGQMVAALQRLEVDIALIEGPCHDAGLQVLPWREDELVIVYGGRHPHSAGLRAGADLRQLRQARWLLREVGSGTREAAEQALLPHLHGFAEVMELGSTEAIKQGAAAGLGLACLSRHVVADLVALGRLEYLATPLPVLSRQLWVVSHPGRQLSGNVVRLLEMTAGSCDPR
ncbi:LysR family transcriptional regulator [Stenotrophomonas sp. YIM B06876]|uniref:LysR family transcriptional regulator n=1 Tax=Stenotrophomonas sp. YIM B06876 TaxID=3060211 RepID=UPI00273A0570|nr:LysR family transcriptional regulator [Stenotrophomonas sp. YIM B06876]